MALDKTVQSQILAGVALCGVLLTAYALWTFTSAWSAVRWEQTDAWVEKSEVEDASAVEGSTRAGYTPVVRYRYEVGDREYTSTRLAAADAMPRVYGSEARAQRDVEQWPLGRRVPVYYDPDDPATAALQVGGNGAWVYLGLGLVLMIGGGIGFRATLRD